MYKLKRIILLMLLAAGAAVPGIASDYVKVTDADNKAVYFAIDEKPTIVLTSASLKIITTKQTVEYPITEYRAVTLENPTTSDITSAAYAPVFSIGTSLRAEGLQPGSAVTVCDAAGLVVGSAKASAEGRVDIPLDNQQGIFIVKTTSRTFKFIKR